ncbi:MAG: aminotransferase class V-fold PLP-dependent enzyme, partial [Planctomycetales bacterium]|nr:aminotransferase class V-fold PLP-dependent enzyme [Planctomycetales bacterium]
MRRRRIIMQAHQHQPAFLGGAPLLPGGPPDWPPADENVRENLLAAYREGAWGKYRGEYVPRLESLVAQRHETPLALACCSGTIAVELALRGLRIGPADEVLLAGYDFAGNFRAIEAVGATPVLVDLEPGTWTMDPQQAADAIGPATKAMIVSHLHSSVAPMRELVDLARQRGLRVVEDACQAQGAIVQGRPAGAWGDVGVWSFGGSKLLSAGRGGAIFTRHE